MEALVISTSNRLQYAKETEGGRVVLGGMLLLIEQLMTQFLRDTAPYG